MEAVSQMGFGDGVIDGLTDGLGVIEGVWDANKGISDPDVMREIYNINNATFIKITCQSCWGIIIDSLLSSCLNWSMSFASTVPSGVPATDPEQSPTGWIGWLFDGDTDGEPGLFPSKGHCWVQNWIRGCSDWFPEYWLKSARVITPSLSVSQRTEHSWLKGGGVTEVLMIEHGQRWCFVQMKKSERDKTGNFKKQRLRAQKNKDPFLISIQFFEHIDISGYHI